MTTKQLRKSALKRVPWHFWFCIGWWRYLLDSKTKRASYATWWHRFWCRAAGHPEGPWWYSWGPEPDMTCKGCGDEL